MVPRGSIAAAGFEQWPLTVEQPEPGRVARLLARVRWFSLNERLVSGEDPADSALLAAHAARLTSRGHRDEIADALNGLLRAAQQLPRASRITPDASALLANEPAVRGAADRLERSTPVYARGVARLERLVTDASGPAFHGGVAALADELAAAEAELRGGGSSGRTAALASGRRAPRRVSPRRKARWPRVRSGWGPRPDRGAVTGSSFVLPNGSWFHGRRDSA